MTNKDNIIFVCIGTNKIIGDCLGPLVGTYLKSKFREYNNIKIYGDIYSPIDYTNIDKILNSITYKNDNTIRICIDSALGNDVGKILINSKELYIGKALEKNRKILSDINIKGVVGKNYKSKEKNIEELKSKKFEDINKLAISIVDFINVACTN